MSTCIEKGTLVTAKIFEKNDTRQGTILSYSGYERFSILGTSGDVYECEGVPSIVENPPVETIPCDICSKDITHFDHDLFHMTVLLDGELNTHTHMCAKCFSKYVANINVIGRAN